MLAFFFAKKRAKLLLFFDICKYMVHFFAFCPENLSRVPIWSMKKRKMTNTLVYVKYYLYLCSEFENIG